MKRSLKAYITIVILNTVMMGVEPCHCRRQSADILTNVL